MDRVNGRRQTPVNQVLHTNVATVRLDRAGSHFEIACYRNKVLSWRNKAETDLGEVLQVDMIFTSVVQGKLAAKKDVTRCFESSDPKDAIKYILDHGELQVSEQEREALQENMIRDVAAIVVEKAINPENNRPYTLTMIQTAMRQIHYSVNTTKGAKSQALDVIRRLKAVMPIARAKMRVRIEYPLTLQYDIRKALEEEMKGIKLPPAVNVDVDVDGKAGMWSELGTGSGTELGSVTAVSTVFVNDTEVTVQPEQEQKQEPEEEQESGQHMSSFELLVDPEAYRTLQDITLRICGKRGFVTLMQMNASTGAAVESVVMPAAVRPAVADADDALEDALNAIALQADMEREAKQNGNGKANSKISSNNNDSKTASAAAGDDDNDDDANNYTAQSKESNILHHNKASKRDKRAAKSARAEREAQATLLKARLERERVKVEATAAVSVDVAVTVEGDVNGSSVSSTSTVAVAGGKACNTCGGSFDSAGYRDHFRSEWHRFNLKIKLKNKKPIDEESFLALSVEELALAND